jgi:hypothetical protein
VWKKQDRRSWTDTGLEVMHRGKSTHGGYPKGSQRARGRPAGEERKWKHRESLGLLGWAAVPLGPSDILICAERRRETEEEKKSWKIQEIQGVRETEKLGVGILFLWTCLKVMDTWLGFKPIVLK